MARDRIPRWLRPHLAGVHEHLLDMARVWLARDHEVTVDLLVEEGTAYLDALVAPEEWAETVDDAAGDAAEAAVVAAATAVAGPLATVIGAVLGRAAGALVESMVRWAGYHGEELSDRAIERAAVTIRGAARRALRRARAEHRRAQRLAEQ